MIVHCVIANYLVMFVHLFVHLFVQAIVHKMAGAIENFNRKLRRRYRENCAKHTFGGNYTKYLVYTCVLQQGCLLEHIAVLVRRVPTIDRRPNYLATAQSAKEFGGKMPNSIGTGKQGHPQQSRLLAPSQRWELFKRAFSRRRLTTTALSSSHRRRQASNSLLVLFCMQRDLFIFLWYVCHQSKVRRLQFRL